MEYVKKHVKIVHEGHKPEARSRNHKCPQCGKAFIQPSDLRRHVVAVHEGLKQHVCVTCGKAFSDYANLRKHIRSVHEGQKNYKCEYCGKAFFDKTQHKKHVMGVHMGQRPDKSMKSKELLNHPSFPHI